MSKRARLFVSSAGRCCSPALVVRHGQPAMTEHTTRQRPKRLVREDVHELWALLFSVCGSREWPGWRKRKLAPVVSSSVAGREAGTTPRNMYSPHGCSSLRDGDESSETRRSLLVMVKCMVDRAEMVVAGQKKRPRPARRCASTTRRRLRT
jgi:hypothetical protein